MMPDEEFEWKKNMLGLSVQEKIAYNKALCDFKNEIIKIIQEKDRGLYLVEAVDIEEMLSMSI